MMLTLDDLVERVRGAAGAEFAFALSFDAALLTHDAPQQMPEAARKLLVTTAEEFLGQRVVGFVCLARGDLVPYGGPGPVEVAFAVAASSRIICVVTTTSARRTFVREVMEQHLPAIEAFFAPPDAPNAAPHIELRAPVLMGDATMAAINLETLRQEMQAIAAATQTAKLGMEAPVAPKAAPMRQDEPAAHDEPARDKLDGPRIAVEPARRLGPETLSAIRRDILVEGAPIERPAIPQNLRRQTMPWIDPTQVPRKTGDGKE